jgi:GDP-L-fucose synthase
MKKNSKIFITGNTGLVGKNLINKMKKDGYNNLIYETHKNLDLLNQRIVNKYFVTNRPNYVIHTAAKVGGIQANINNPYGFLYENLMIQNNVINACIKYRVKKVIFLASTCMYPRDYKQPLKEEYILEAPVEPTNESYALAKICGAKLCQYANKQFDTKFIVLSLSNLYGDGDNFHPENSHVLSALIKKIYDAKINEKKEVVIWGTGKPRREFLYVDDLGDCIVWAMNNLEKIDTFLNVGTGKDVSIIELANIIKDVVNYKGMFVFDTSKSDGMMLKCSDVSKINKLGWKATTSLKKGIKKTVQYYKTIIEKDLQGK